MAPRNWLHLLLALRPAAHPLDEIRLQIGLCLLVQRAELRDDQAYRFEQPASSGPRSAQLSADLEALVDEGLAVAVQAGTYEWSRYVISETGFETARALTSGIVAADVPTLRTLAEIKTLLCERPLGDLIELARPLEYA